MSDPTMIYKAPGPHLLHGYQVEYSIVESEELEAMLADGWYRTPTEAGEALVPVEQDPADRIAPQHRETMLKMAEELKIKVDGRWNDARLQTEIDAKLRE